ncbi:hypothetical protein EEB11_06680 [Pseudotabrizicola sediminis]|uniref:Major facilitator superfamily (MFS) profile domain-containing protein n=1 Tax=Pseudotabrizicola sediminis TaxID=2486418 RepID=A0ABY2KTE7_9RHOB|nr:hypothetical protein [Pseudotabrizicola sediminis]TGD44356.1 hypothetical protein EEB11_06680 [Pseudotabrizicola sediminis]
MRRVFRVVVGMVTGAVSALVIGIGLPMVIPISQAEGAYMMGIMFFWVPLAAVCGSVIGGLIGGRSPH